MLYVSDSSTVALIDSIFFVFRIFFSSPLPREQGAFRRVYDSIPDAIRPHDRPRPSGHYYVT